MNRLAADRLEEDLAGILPLLIDLELDQAHRLQSWSSACITHKQACCRFEGSRGRHDSCGATSLGNS